ncbi:MAG: hypothetical protein ABI844_10670 [Saprospiraceae bacterium]
MGTLHPQIIKDVEGKDSMVILPIKEYQMLIEELEDMEDVRLYDEAKKNDDGVRISLSEVFRRIEEKRTLHS